MDSMVKRRKAQASIMTVVAIAVVAAIGAMFGTIAFIMAVLPLPVPLLLLWLSADVFRADERVAVERAPWRASAQEPAPAAIWDAAKAR